MGAHSRSGCGYHRGSSSLSFCQCFVPPLAGCSHGLHGSQVGGQIKIWCRYPGKIQGEPSGENKMIYFLDRVLPRQDELCRRLLGIRCRTTNILHLQPLRRPNFFNDFFFLKYMNWLPQGHCQEPSERLSKLLVTSEPSELPSASVPAAPLPSRCLEAGATLAKTVLQIGHQLPAWGLASALPPLFPRYRAGCREIFQAEEQTPQSAHRLLGPCGQTPWGLNPRSAPYRSEELV